MSQVEYTPLRLHEMDQLTWAHYEKRVTINRNNHKARKPADLREVEFLYHATSPGAFASIQKNGLCPRDPRWREYKKTDKVPRFDASKDGFLSMATTLSGAGAMGQYVLLRMRVGSDIGDWDFRQVGASTEVRTLYAIPPDRLEYSEDGKSWKPLTK